jgi:NTP pyrophosphatase (non-canonical NTP hydrolase)
MLFNDLQRQLLRTANFDEPLDRALSLCGLGLCGEAGEVVDLIKKVFYHHHEFDAGRRAKMIEESGDVIWYVAYLTHMLGLTLEQTLATVSFGTWSENWGENKEPDKSFVFTRLGLKLGRHCGNAALLVDYLVYDEFPFIASELKSNESRIQHLLHILGYIMACLWQLSVYLDSSLEEMCQVVIDKLNRRYPQGFSTAASLARADVEVQA